MKHSRGKFVAQLVTVVAVVALTCVHTCRPVTADDAKLEFFENRIRPVLVEHCYKCHSATSKNVRGGLLLDSKAGVVAGGESGPIIVPSHPEESLLISSLKHESFEMPPDRKLPDTVIADFERWIRDGAIDPREGGKPLERKQIDLTEGRKFWSFQPIAKPTVPTADGSGWAKTENDHFIAAKHAATNSRVAADASAEQVVRRRREFISIRAGGQDVEVAIALHRVGIDHLDGGPSAHPVGDLEGQRRLAGTGRAEPAGGRGGRRDRHHSSTGAVAPPDALRSLSGCWPLRPHPLPKQRAGDVPVHRAEVLLASPRRRILVTFGVLRIVNRDRGQQLVGDLVNGRAAHAASNGLDDGVHACASGRTADRGARQQ